MDKLVDFFKAPGKVLKELFLTAKDNLGFLAVSVIIVALILAVAFGAESYFAKKNGRQRRIKPMHEMGTGMSRAV